MFFVFLTAERAPILLRGFLLGGALEFTENSGFSGDVGGIVVFGSDGAGHRDLNSMVLVFEEILSFFWEDSRPDILIRHHRVTVINVNSWWLRYLRHFFRDGLFFRHLEQLIFDGDFFL